MSTYIYIKWVNLRCFTVITCYTIDIITITKPGPRWKCISTPFGVKLTQAYCPLILQISAKVWRYSHTVYTNDNYVAHSDWSFNEGYGTQLLLRTKWETVAAVRKLVKTCSHYVWQALQKASTSHWIGKTIRLLTWLTVQPEDGSSMFTLKLW